jgi:signal transduction histidine kinase/CheY-like chemotaxis protein
VTLSGSTILVVDDEPANRRLLQAILKPEGASIVHAACADEALARIEGGGIDLVLLDVMMPGIDGIETCRQIRKRQDYIPVVLVTALVDSASRVGGKDAGADDFLTKPVNEDELIVRVRNLLSLRALHQQTKLESQRWRMISEVANVAATCIDQQSFVQRLKTTLAPVVELDCVGILDVTNDLLTVAAACSHPSGATIPLPHDQRDWPARICAAGQLHVTAAEAPLAPLLQGLGLEEAVVVPSCGAGMLHQFVILARHRPFAETELAWLRQLGLHVGSGANNVRLHVRSERLLQARDQLGRFVVHDVRNMLVAIQMNIDLAAEAATSDDRAANLGDARCAVERLSALSSELLDIGAAEEGRLAVNHRATDLKQLALEAMQHVVPQYESRAAVITADEPVIAEVDTRLMRRLFENVLGNAARYARAGSRIEVRVEQVSGRAIVSIMNEGSRIPAPVREQLFEKYGTDDRRTRTGGLGLYFCRLVAEAHGGTIRAVDVDGACIQIDMPIARMPAV